MTRVDFYILEPADPQQHALFICRLADKVCRQGHQVHIRCLDRAHADSLDSLLWTFHDTSFVPHAAIDDCHAASAPVVIGYGDALPLTSDVLVNLHPEVPEFFSRFERVVETAGCDGPERQAARNRYRFYQQRGYPLTTHHIGDAHG